MVTSVGGVQVAEERGITVQRTFVPQYAREHAKLDRLRCLAETGRLPLRVARPCRPNGLPSQWRLRHADHASSTGSSRLPHGSTRAGPRG
jgi:hypothetical protein